MYENTYYKNNSMNNKNIIKKKEKNKPVSLFEDQQNKNFIDVDYVAELLKLKC